jgi:hypothetical protein
MFYNYDDPQFKDIVDSFILSSANDDKQLLSYAIKNIDYQASKLGISFYEMMFLLIQKNSYENRKRRKKKC